MTTTPGPGTGPSASPTRSTTPASPASAAPGSVVDGALRLAPYWATVLRRTWKGGLISALVTPLLYVVAMGVLLGGFIEVAPGELEGATSYLAFVAPGLLAAHVMTLVIGETTYPVMSGVKWHKTFFAMHATPLGIGSIVLANVGFILLRTLVVSAFFVAVLAPFGVFTTWWGAVLAWATQALVIGAFTTPVFAFAAGLQDETAFALVFRLGMIPMFLFSGAFFPVGNLDAPLEVVARLTPLWHGVDLTRMFALGTFELGPALVHVAYLVALTALGWWWAVRRLRARMVV